jgi:hypothetical protein
MVPGCQTRLRRPARRLARSASAVRRSQNVRGGAIVLRECPEHGWGWWATHDDAAYHRPISRPGGVRSLDELQQRGGRSAMLLLDLLSVLGLHAIERVSEALVAAVELLE